MRKKIIQSFLLIFMSSFLIGFGILYGVLYQVSINQETETLFDEISVISMSNQEMNNNLGKELSDYGKRLTVITEDGKVLYDNTNAQIKENHLQRKEIKEAITSGKGNSIRHSNTMNQDYLYAALYDDEDDIVIRLAVPFNGITESAMLLTPVFLIVFVIAFIIVWFLSKRLAASIVKPFQDISNVIRKANFGKEDIVLKDHQYPELTEITDAISTMNAQISKNLEKLERERKIREEFFTNASHELKTPLTSIRGYSELLKTHAIVDDEQKEKCLDRILSESDHMTKLINDILTISELETKDYVVTMSHIKVKEVLNNVIENLSVQANSANVSIQSDCEDIIVYASLDHIQRILYNLVSNAIKYNKPNGKVYVDIKARLKDMRIKVSDTGIGIAKSKQKRVFQRFYRVDKQRTKTVAGTGIGLAIVKHIVEFYHGEIILKSKVDVGTTIIVSLPILENK